MSHAATNWAIQQRGLKPTTKIVLWHLCDRYNPDFGCFPTQERLALDCEIGRATLNRHLDDLEARGLIRRVPIIDTKTGQQRPTRYLLGFELTGLSKGTPDPEGGSETPSHPPAAPLETPCLDLGHGTTGDTAMQCTGVQPPTPAPPCLEPGHGPVSHFGVNPCLKNGDSRVSKWDTNPVREPLSKPVKEEEVAQARANLDDDFFWRAAHGAGLRSQRRPARLVARLATPGTRPALADRSRSDRGGDRCGSVGLSGHPPCPAGWAQGAGPRHAACSPA